MFGPKAANSRMAPLTVHDLDATAISQGERRPYQARDALESGLSSLADVAFDLASLDAVVDWSSSNAASPLALSSLSRAEMLCI